MTGHIDVLGLGCVAVDDLLFVRAYPAPDTKVPILRTERHCGGLAATALVAAARLGVRAAYAGTLGNDELSQFALSRLAEQGVSVEWVRRRPGVRPIHAVILVDETQHTRTIFFDLEGAVGAELDWPAEDVLRSAKAVFVDHFGVEGMLRAARVARHAGIPVVADFESAEHPQFPELLASVDHLIVSRDFASRLTGQADPAAAVRKLWTPSRQAVVVTCGADGCWYVGAEAPEAPRHHEAFRVAVVDTTGCGDVFHGAYIAGLIGGLDLKQRVRLASAAAALKATRPGGQPGIPTQHAVAAFLAEHAPPH